MGIILNWSTGYTGTLASIDNTTTDFPIVIDGTHDVMASHVNSLAEAVIQLQTIQVSILTTPLSIPDGTEALPGAPFASDLDTGIYRPLDNVIGFSTFGNERLRITDSGTLPGDAGTYSLGSASLYWGEIWGASAEGATTSGPSAAAYDLTLTGVNAGAYAIGVNTALLANTGGTTTDLMTTLDELDAVISAGGGATLQTAYNGGSTVTLVENSPVALDLTVATASGVESIITASIDATAQTTLGDGYNLLDLSIVEPTSIATPGDQNFIKATLGIAEVFRVNDLGEVKAADGSVSSPSLSFVNADSSGIYAASATDLRFVTNGLNRIRFSNTYWSPWSDGAMTSGRDNAGWIRVYAELGVGVPGIANFTWAGDGDTGLYHPAADAFAATAGGTEVARFQTDGLGANPQMLLADGTAANPALAFASDIDTGLYYTSATLRFSIAGTQQLYLRSNELSPIADGGLSLGTTVTGFDNVYGQSSGGSEGVPTFTWAADTDTGFYKPVADSVSATGGGTEVARFSAPAGLTPQVQVPLGTNTNPGLTFLGDTDTGWYIGSIGGAMKLTISSTSRYQWGSGEYIPLVAGTDLGATGFEWDRLYAQTSMVYGGGGTGFTIQGIDETTAGTAAETLTIATGDGAAASGGGVDAGNAGDLVFTGGVGGAGNSTDAAARGGGFAITGGTGGAGTASVVGGDGGSFIFTAGSPGATGGAGTGVGGWFSLLGRSDSAIQLNVPSTGPTGQVLEIGASYGFGDPGPAKSSLVLYAGIAPIPATAGEILMFARENVSIGNGVSGKYVNFYPGTGATETGRFDNVGLKVAGGSFGNPSISFISATSTGFRLSGSDIQVTVGGSDTWNFANDQSLYNYGSGEILNDDGDVGNPAYSFRFDTDTGIYRSAGDTMVLVTGGTASITCNNAAAQIHDELRLPNGTEVAPSCVWTGDNNTGFYRPIDGWDSTGVGVTIQGDEVARFENDNAWDDGNLQITKDFVGATAVEQVWQVNVGAPDVFVDETSDAANATSNDTNLYPAVSATGDYAAFGMDQEFFVIIFDAAGGTGGTNQPGITWEYWDGATWSALTMLAENTNGFSVTADNLVVEWKPPADWATTALNSVTKYYVRARISSSAFTTSPIYDQVKILGEQVGVAVNLQSLSAVTAGTFSRMNALKIHASGTPGGVASIRYLTGDYEGALKFSIQDHSSGGAAMYLRQSASPVYGFLDSNNYPDENLGMTGDSTNQRINFLTDVSGTPTEQFRILTDQVQGPDGLETAPGHSFLNETGMGMYRIGASRLGFAANGESVVVDNDSITPSFHPDADNVWTLGEASLRWADLFATTTTVGDIIMHDKDEGADSPFLILREGHETIEVFDVQANKKFIIPLQEVPMTPEDQARIDAAKAKLYS